MKKVFHISRYLRIFAQNLDAMVTEADVVRVVETYYQVKYKDMLEKNTQQYPFGIAKNTIIHIFRTVLGMKWHTIGEKFDMTPRNAMYRDKTFTTMLSAKTRTSVEYKEIISMLNK